MFVLCLIVTASVLTVIWGRWDHIQRWTLGMSGLLSIAVGVRSVALATAFYLLPGIATAAWGEETSPGPAAAEATAVGETPVGAEAPAIAVAEAPVVAEAPAVAESPAAEAPPVSVADSVVTTPAQPEAAATTSDATSELPAESKSTPTAEKEPSADNELEAKEQAAGDKDQAAPSPDESKASANVDEKVAIPQAEKDDPSAFADTKIDSQIAKATTREPVKFITNISYLAENRPSWLETLPTYEGDSYCVPVRAGPYPTIRDCESDLEEEVSVAAADFINEHLKAKHASTFISYTLDDLRRRKVVREQFSEQLETSLGLMNQVHAKLVFDDSFRDEVDARWSEITSKSRLAQTGLGAGVVLLLLSTLFSYFKLDTATKGYYTGRLQFATAGAILTLVAASVVLAKWIPWM